MFDGFLKKGFRGANCKTLLKLVIPRIKIMRNKREAQLKQMRRDIAKLLENGEEATARIRVEHIIREENMMAAQEIIELFCELIAARLPIIEMQRECPLDLKEAIASVCFAAPRCPDLVELPQIQMQFALKYGKEFVAAATELMPDCGVNRQVIELLSVRAPSPEIKLKLLKDIAEEHELDWDPAATEAEYFKQHEDLLNGPTQFISGSKLPLPEEKHDESFLSAPVQAPHKQVYSESSFDDLDLPEVPNTVPTSRLSSEPKENCRSHLSSPSMDSQQEFNTSGANENAKHEYHLGQDEVQPKESLSEPHVSSSTTEGTKVDKQFLPFIIPPFSSPSVDKEEESPQLPRTTIETNDLQEQSQFPAQTLSRTKSQAPVDLEDVLAAAQAAAETAERAAAAARSAASLMQLRISELNQRKEGPQVRDNNEKEFEMDGLKHPAVSDSPTFPNGDNASPGDYSGGSNPGLLSPKSPVFDSPKMESDAGPSPGEQSTRHQSPHQPLRLPSMEDDPYFSYPNLFTSPTAGYSSDNSPQHPPKPE
ncbi:hypothetical protein H6P81_011138 [Aristolochia fimbriata]|uniref:IST1 homolog n=1 Tax=Aristolochia fimbriata TaxID=158543 RepID=A0AAV7EV58_ARIFI|nr:hypothetical protein H6P81_011138 [Aristolochia fimbriata]